MIQLLKFTKPNCRPCVFVSNYLSELEPQLAAEGVALTEHNVAESPDLIDKYDLKSAPTLIFLRNGAEMARITGMTDSETIMDCVRTAKEAK